MKFFLSFPNHIFALKLDRIMYDLKSKFVVKVSNIKLFCKKPVVKHVGFFRFINYVDTFHSRFSYISASNPVTHTKDMI